MRSKMYLVLALCSVMLLVSVGISLVLIGGIGDVYKRQADD